MKLHSIKHIIDSKLITILKTIYYPNFKVDIVSIGLVLEARLTKKKATIKLRPLAAPREVFKNIENSIATAIANSGIEELELIQPDPFKKQKIIPTNNISGIKTIVPIASGKGGVGKSTIAINLAINMVKLGLKVGLLDLDLYGPSIPLMLNINNITINTTNNKKLMPIEVNGLKTMSIGFLVKNNKALIWRGPIIIKAVKQLLYDVNWAPLDILILDLPPGTGDIQLTMTQEISVTGAIIVTTPQNAALIDVIKTIDMFRTTNTKILGIVENMSYFICNNCNKRHEIFGHGSVKPLAQKICIEYLNELPLDPNIRIAMDTGQQTNEIISSKPYYNLANNIWNSIKNYKTQNEN